MNKDILVWQRSSILNTKLKLCIIFINDICKILSPLHALQDLKQRIVVTFNRCDFYKFWQFPFTFVSQCISCF